MKPEIFNTILILLTLFPMFLSNAHAASPTIVISEIAWAGTISSASDEWIEIYNLSETDVDLTGWGLYEDGGAVLIEPLQGTIPAKSYFVIERTDNTTLPSITASQEPSSWSGGGLSNSGEHLVLKDSGGVIVDEVNALAGWFTGGGVNSQSMQRINLSSSGNDSANWAGQANPNPEHIDVGGKNIYATPLADYVVVQAEEESESSPEINYQLRISEILANPEGNDDYEYLEIENYSSEIISLMGWKIKDATSTKLLDDCDLENDELAGSDFIAIHRRDGGSSLNNGGEEITLLSPDGAEVDKVEFPALAEGVAYALFDGEFKQTAKPTDGEENILEEVDEEDEEGDEEQEDDEEDPESDEKSTPDYLTFTIGSLLTQKSGVKVIVSGKIVCTITTSSGVNYYLHDSFAGIKIVDASSGGSDYQVGDVLTVTGILRRLGGENYVKGTTMHKLINTVIPEIPVRELSDNSDLVSLIGNLVSGQGKVTRQDQYGIIVDTGLGDIRVAYPTDYEVSANKDDSVKFTGILAMNGKSDNGQNKFKIYIRTAGDLVVLSSATNSTAKGNQPEASAASASGSQARSIFTSIFFLLSPLILLIVSLVINRLLAKSPRINKTKPL